MATSGSVDFSLTAQQVVTAALRLIGVTPHDEDPSAEEADVGLQQLNLMLKTWGADPKPKLWLKSTYSLTLVASTASYNLGTTPGARKVLSVQRRTGSGTSQRDIPLQMWSREEYLEFPSKAATGQVYGWYFDQQRASRTLYVVNTPDSTEASAATLQVEYLRIIEDADALSNDNDVPQEWLEVVEYGLAARLIYPMRAHLSDAAGCAGVEKRAADLYGQLSSYDDESGSVFMQPAA